MRRILIATVFTLVTLQRTLAADVAVTLYLKDGRTVSAPSVRVTGNTLMASVVDNGIKGEIGYPLDTVTKADFPQPPQFQACKDLLAQNKAAEALREIAPVLDGFYPLRNVPGNWWAQAALIKINALDALGREKDAQPLLDSLAGAPLDPVTMQSVRLQQAAGWARNGQYDKAVAVYDSTLSGTRDSSMLAQAWVLKGQSLLAQKKWEPAVLAFLHVPVFYPDQKLFMPAALLGSARALTGLDAFGAAKERLGQLVESYPASPEAAAARIELERLNKRKA
jgi:TolA-binding protein